MMPVRSAGIDFLHELARPGGADLAICVAPAWDLPCFPEERDALARATAARRREFATGRDCARRALARLGASPVALPPDADGLPRWPPGFTGSISHGGGLCCAAVARTSDVAALGIDVERIVPFEPSLARRVCRADERARIVRMPGLDGYWPNLVFSAKEAVYKCLSPRFGCFLEFEDVGLAFTIESAAGHGRFRVVDAMPGRWEGAARALEGRWLIAGDHIFASAVEHGRCDPG